MLKIARQEFTLEGNQDIDLTKRRAITFFEELWLALEAEPTKVRLERAAVLQMNPLVVKGMSDNAGHFIQARVQMLEMRVRDLTYSHDEMFRDYGTEEIVTISEKLSGFDKDIKIEARVAWHTDLLRCNSGQLSPAAVLNLLEHGVVTKYDSDNRLMRMMRLSAVKRED